MTNFAAERLERDDKYAITQMCIRFHLRIPETGKNDYLLGFLHGVQFSHEGCLPSYWVATMLIDVLQNQHPIGM